MQHQSEACPADGIVIPPGCENPLFTNSGEKVQTYTPASYRPYSQKIGPHGMRGKSDSISMPECPTKATKRNLTDYLKQFQGAALCLDLWTAERQKWKRCGVLLEVGEDFLVIGDHTTGNLSIIDLKPVRYINIYCK